MNSELQPRGARQLTAALCEALGVPKTATKAVLTLEVGRPPTLELTMICTDKAGRMLLEDARGENGEAVERRVAKVRFMVRLEVFADHT